MENYLNIRQQGNEEAEKVSNSTSLNWKIAIWPGHTEAGGINYTESGKDSEKSGGETIFEDYTFTEEHRESIIELKQKILNKLEFVRYTNVHDREPLNKLLNTM